MPANGNEAGASGAGAAGGGTGELGIRPIVYTPVDSPSQLLHDGDAMDLWAAPQGGHVLRAGARIRGLDSDFVELRGVLRDLDTGFMITEAVRTVVVAPLENEDGWVETDRSSVSQSVHLALCPNYEHQPIADVAYQLELTVTELYDDFEKGFAAVVVVPTCLQTSPDLLEQCHCECEADYVLGKCGG